MTLSNRTTGETLIPQLELARTLAARNRGLLGRAHLPPDRALWIWRCNWVHTFGMKFAIDLVYVNKKMQVKKTVSRMRPGRLGMPVWTASSVIEFSAGFLEKHAVNIGDTLHVDPAVS